MIANTMIGFNDWAGTHRHARPTSQAIPARSMAHSMAAHRALRIFPHALRENGRQNTPQPMWIPVPSESPAKGEGLAARRYLPPAPFPAPFLCPGLSRRNEPSHPFVQINVLVAFRGNLRSIDHRLTIHCYPSTVCGRQLARGWR